MKTMKSLSKYQAKRKARKAWMKGKVTTHADGNNFVCGFSAGWREGRKALRQEMKE